MCFFKKQRWQVLCQIMKEQSFTIMHNDKFSFYLHHAWEIRVNLEWSRPVQLHICMSLFLLNENICMPASMYRGSPQRLQHSISGMYWNMLYDVDSHTERKCTLAKVMNEDLYVFKIHLKIACTIILQQMMKEVFYTLFTMSDKHNCDYAVHTLICVVHTSLLWPAWQLYSN
jgi:hypothetical protein